MKPMGFSMAVTLVSILGVSACGADQRSESGRVAVGETETLGEPFAPPPAPLSTPPGPVRPTQTGTSLYAVSAGQVSGFAPSSAAGFTALSTNSFTAGVVPDLEYAQRVYASPRGVVLSLLATSYAKPLPSETVGTALSDSVSAGHVASGNDLVEVMVRAENPEELALEPLNSILEVVRGSLRSIPADAVSSADRPEVVMGAVDTQLMKRDWRLVDDRTRYVGLIAQISTIDFRKDDGRTISVSWRSAPSGLTLDVAAGPLAVDFRTVGNRIYAVTPAYPGDAARASWLESGYFVSAAGGQTIEEIVKLAAEIEAVDALALALASVEVESHLDRLPVVSRHRSTVADGAIELASRDIGQVICYATQAIRDCKAADLLLTATWFETNGSIVVVGAFPTRSGSVRVEIDGAAVAPVEDDGYMWIDVDLGQTDRFTFALTVGDVPTQSIDVIVEKAP